MIEGLQMDFPGTELRDHLFKRAEHHRRRQLFYAEQAKAVQAGADKSDNPEVNAKYTNVANNPVVTLQSQAESHQIKAELFQIMGDHLLAGETYRLSESDLIKIELMGRANW